MAKILVIDDDAAFREGLLETLDDLGYEARGAGSSEEGLTALGEEGFDAVLIDFRLPDRDGVGTMRLMRERLGQRCPPMIMITASTDSQNTIEAMSLGAFDHLTKPVSRAEIETSLAAAIRAFGAGAGERKAGGLAAKAGGPKLLGKSERMREVLKMVGRLAATDTTVLVTGETGTGKEVVAQAIHENSARKKGPFVALNCAAIPENLLESELFGHVRGAFTGALADRKGAFQTAAGGTLLLDEIGDMDLNLQAKILRVVQEREFMPVGGNRLNSTDVRLIAATHRDLRELLAKGRFREDLYYRLNVVPLPLPPLRERLDDIEMLALRFLAGNARGPDAFSSEALAKLRGYSWPGNIRELKNVIERASVVAKGPVVEATDIRFANDEAAARSFDVEGLDWHQAIGMLEKKLLSEALRNANGNRSEAARRLGIQRQLLYAKLKEHHLEI